MPEPLDAVADLMVTTPTVTVVPAPSSSTPTVRVIQVPTIPSPTVTVVPVTIPSPVVVVDFDASAVERKVLVVRQEMVVRQALMVRLRAMRVELRRQRLRYNRAVETRLKTQLLVPPTTGIRPIIRFCIPAQR